MSAPLCFLYCNLITFSVFISKKYSFKTRLREYFAKTKAVIDLYIINKKPKYLGEKTSYTSGLVAVFISLLMITYIIDIYFGNHHNIGMKINWWIHAVLILGFLVLIPRSKHLATFITCINV